MINVNYNLVKVEGLNSRKFCTWMCLLNSEKSPFAIYLKKHYFGTLHIPFSAEKHQIWAKLDVFLAKFSKNTPNFANWAHWISDGLPPPPINIPNFMKLHPKR